MKFLAAIFLMTAAMSASAQFASVEDEDNVSTMKAVISAPVNSTKMGANCVFDAEGKSYNDCLALSIIVGPLSTAEVLTILTTVALLKEDIRNVEEDAYDYMAGEPMTLALEELLKEFRERHPELKEAKDKNLIKFIIQNA